MKIYLLTLMSVLLFCCSKKHDCVQKNTNPIHGKWLWEKSFGGISGFEETPANSGKEIILELFDNGVYRYSLNKVAPKVGNFIYNEDHGNGFKTIQFDQDSPQMITELNTFHFEYGDAPVDGISHRYKKQ